MTLHDRLCHAAGGCILLGMLVTARLLQPSEFGFGTHEALGLPPCSAITWFGVPCPTCGMTTSWSYLLRGDLFMSLRCNPGGTCLALVAMVTAVWSLSIAALGNYRALLSIRVASLLAILIASITVVHWLGKIF